MASPSEHVAGDATALLDKMIESSAGVRLVAVELADQLAARGQPEDVALLVKLSQTKAFAKQFGFRRSVIWALVHIDSKPAIGALIGLVGETDGEAQADAIKYLTSVTDQALGNNQAAWAKWWEESASTFTIPSPSSRTLAAADKVSPGVTMYYGLPVYARRIVFIMDTSRSMNGQRLIAAKRELIAAIDRLQPKDQFTVLVFDNDVRMWQKKLVPAEPTAKKRADLFVTKQDTHPQTASVRRAGSGPAIRRRGDLLSHRRRAVRRQSLGPGRDHRPDHGHECHRGANRSTRSASGPACRAARWMSSCARWPRRILAPIAASTSDRPNGATILLPVPPKQGPMMQTLLVYTLVVLAAPNAGRPEQKSEWQGVKVLPKLHAVVKDDDEELDSQQFRIPWVVQDSRGDELLVGSEPQGWVKRPGAAGERRAGLLHPADR